MDDAIENTCLGRVPSIQALRRKRVFDLVLLVILALPSLFLVGVSALLVKLFSQGNVFYRQVRVGLNGSLIEVWKIRTMCQNADEVLAAHLAINPAASNEWNRYFKLKNDPRIIPYIGSFLRRSSLDELPQLFNVLVGEMSLVGPRPLPLYHFREFDLAFQSYRQMVPPGLTGLWQINERSDGDLESHTRWDTRYIKDFSITSDLKILLKTPLVVVKGRGAY